MDWKEYTEEIVNKIQAYDNAIIVGISGSYKRRINKLRVYVHGGIVLQIPISRSRKFDFADDYLKEDYLTTEECKQIEEIRNRIIANPYAWGDNNFSDLDTYFKLVNSATMKKFRILSGSKSEKQKERNCQIDLYKHLMNESENDFAIFDIEFQSIAEMNYSRDVIDKEKNEKGSIKGLHTGKPDYIAVTKDGFIIIELKTNLKACRGSAGLGIHNTDNENLMKINSVNHILINEFITRLKVMKEYGLINTKYSDSVDIVLEKEKDLNNLVVVDKYILLTSPNATAKQYLDIAKEQKVPRDKIIIV